MGYKVLIFGSTGMVGKGVLLECVDQSIIDEIILINRRPTDVTSSKITEHLASDFSNLSELAVPLEEIDACFFCLGVSALGKTEAEYTKITYDIALNVGRALSAANPKSVFCFVSGMGTDINGSAMWARVKARTEQDLRKLPFQKVVCFRPGFIQPMKGIKSATWWYNALYAIMKPLTPLLKAMSPQSVTNTTNVGLAMIACLTHDQHPEYLDNRSINALATEFLGSIKKD